MTYDVEHLFICLFTICVFSLMTYLFKSLAYFLIELFIFLLMSVKSSLYILVDIPLSAMSFANIFSHLVFLFSWIVYILLENNFNYFGKSVFLSPLYLH